MIVTITPNPSVDRTLEVERLDRGATLRAVGSRVDPGGKGVNVARALAANGHKVRAVLPVGGAEGTQLLDLLAMTGVEIVPVLVGEPIRSNLTLVEPDGTVTKIDASGPRLSQPELEALMEEAVLAAADAEWVACCGSLPPGVPADFWGRLIGRLEPGGARVALDTSGAPLLAGLEAGPDLVKPNLDELAEAVGRPLASIEDAVAAGGLLRDRGAGAVLASLGPRGAVLVDGSVAVHGTAPVAAVRSTVGAGDALLAGFLTVGAGAEGLVEGLAWAAAACSLPGSAMPTPDDIDRSQVRTAAVPVPDQPGGTA